MMNINRKWFALSGLILSTGLMVSSLRADDDGPREGTRSMPTTQPRGRVSLEHEMGAMGRDYRTIRQQVADSTKNASTLAALLDLEQHTVAAKGAVLRAATTMPTADAKAAKQADYQGDMITLLRHELDLEEQLLANENDKAAKTVSDLHDLETEGHKEFRPKRGDR